MKALDPKLIAVAVLAVGAGLWWVSRRASEGGIGDMAENAARSLVGAVSNAVGGAAVGTVKGIGSVVGIPDTNQTTCNADIAAGRWWDASFSCPAGTYINTAGGAVFGSTTLWDSDAVDARAIEAAKARAQFALTDPRRVDLDPYMGMSPEEYRMYNGGF